MQWASTGNCPCDPDRPQYGCPMWYEPSLVPESSPIHAKMLQHNKWMHDMVKKFNVTLSK